MKPFLKSPLKFSRGNSLIKYTFIGAWVIAGCVAGFLILSGQETSSNKPKPEANQFDNRRSSTMLSFRHRMIPASPQDSVHFKGAPIDTDGKLPTELRMDLTAQERLYLARSVNLKLQILGPSATTKLIARQISQLGRQMLAERKITYQQSALLMQMAKQGFRIAQLEGLVEMAVHKAGGDAEKLKNLKFMYSKDAVNAYDLVAKIGFNNQSPQDYARIDLLTDAGHAQSEMANFLNLYNQAQASVQVDQPELRATLASTATQIAIIGESIQALLTTGNSVNSNKIPKGSEFNDSVANSAAPINVAKVCTFADFSADGISCHKN